VAQHSSRWLNRKGGAAIRWHPLRPTRFRCTLSPNRVTPNRNRVRHARGDASQRPGCEPPANPRFTRALRSLHRNTPTSNALCHPRAPPHRLRPTGSYRPLRFWNAEGSASPNGSGSPRHPPAGRGSSLCLERGRRNDPRRLPSYLVPASLRTVGTTLQPCQPSVLRRRTGSSLALYL